MTRPTKDTPAGRAYLELQNRARRDKRPTQELLTLYVLERWLARLAESPHVGEFVLKGGVLLAVFEARRPTADADLLARNMPNDEASVVARVIEIAEGVLDPDDGVRFLTGTAVARTIRDDDLYSGVRVGMDCELSTAKVKLWLDVNFGDPITPAPRVLELPSQRPGVPGVPVLGYPVETVLAEKSSTAIALGDTSTRVRDYVNLYTLTGRQVLSYESVRAALDATTSHRGVELQPLSAVLGEFVSLREGAYRAFKRRLGVDGVHLPERFADVVAAVVEFVDPLTEGDFRKAWNPSDRRWL
ncbi:nucleotidyl transferase AbiEii/AbiGii toxin family protein [Lentzea sp. NEAU-D13]|uniref:Nucleotidyl transferase AbiEii/AbiGii toxin family protein n=1 Tax=Lentzea alba TaxID=2714351 RepID=A0A7C9RYP1_9PSEU|nr:nucleotidyl transferase AbiEii/AbiGii toxin family protein [Lentzea alba]NGY66247.1 nucleotidyl transferase AbiEii/AbiGii toxin family protein [Lentzea alba]